MANDDFIDFEEKLIRDYILVTGVNSEFKFYPYFKITSDFALNNRTIANREIFKKQTHIEYLMAKLRPAKCHRKIKRAFIYI